MITEKQTAWGSKYLEQLSQDLRTEFSNMQGFSERNLKYCRQFYQFCAPSIGQQLVAQLEQANKKNDSPQIVSPQDFNTVFRQQPVAQIPWGHHILIFSKTKSTNEAEFYVGLTLQNGWSRNIFSLQMDANLFQRQGKAIHNFQNTAIFAKCVIIICKFCVLRCSAKACLGATTEETIYTIGMS